jgi:DNA-directed RNA polymerase specialized sigma24 family protein
MEVLEMEPVTRCETDSKQLFERLYIEAFPKAARFISKKHGSFDDAKDIFQDALVIYYEKSRETDFDIKITADAYLLGIVKHLWFRKFHKDQRQSSLPDFIENIPLPENNVAINSKRLLNLLEKTGKKCMDLLRSIYYEEHPVKDIVRSSDYSTEHSVSVQKYKCLEKIRDIVKEKSTPYEAFTD